jgi:hypothetical protein
MLNTYNPVLNGIMTAYGLAERIRSAAMDQQRLEFEKTREKRMAEEAAQLSQQRERRMSMDDANMRLALLTNPNLAEVGADDVRTIEAQISDPALQKAYGAPSVSMGVPTEGAVEYGGKRYAVRGRGELLNEQLGEKRILSEAENVAAGEKARKVFEATAVPLPAELATRARLTPGTLVSPTVIDDIVRAAGAGEGAPVNWQAQMTDQGLVQVNPRSGEVRRPTLAGATLTRKPRTASGEMTANQRATQARLERGETRAADKAKRDELAKLENEETELAPKVIEHKQLASGWDAQGDKVKPGAVLLAKSKLRVMENRLKQIRKRKVELGFTTAEEAGLPGGAGAVAAAPKTWEDYKRSKTGGQ